MKGTTLGSLGLWVASAIFNLHMVSKVPFLIVFFVISTGMLVSSRLILRMVLEQARLHGRNLRNVLIVGTSRRALEFADEDPGQPGAGLSSHGVRRPVLGWNRINFGKPAIPWLVTWMAFQNFCARTWWMKL